MKKRYMLILTMVVACVFNNIITARAEQYKNISQKEALDFLYKYMPDADKYGHDKEFFEKNVEVTMAAREEMPWGMSVPDREFLHFVLPLSVNNEILDESRPVFFDELKNRVKGLSMEDAILEVNHWTHEKATYQPSDARTSSPLSTVSQAIGRCGEESTFLVAALRSVCIPARQVYTPRWAHTDDNHAWVEAWANGKWYFLGACEPEPILNLAWFNAPASRGMLMNTNVYGEYDGPEEVLLQGQYNTRINITENYAPVGSVKVKVVNMNNNPVEGADVLFCLYNYAEYYTLAKKKTDSEGRATLTTGMGNVIVWASDSKNFAFDMTSPMDDELVLKLEYNSDYNGVKTFDIVPPAVSALLPTPTSRQIEENEVRKVYEDSIRNAYIATFATVEDAEKLARELNVNTDELVKILRQSRGNHKNISEILQAATPGQRDVIMKLLLVVEEKDRRDIPMDVIYDNMNVKIESNPLFEKYVLNPRIEFEPLTPWRGKLSKLFSKKEIKEFRKNPSLLVKKVNDLIKVSDDVYSRGLPSSPVATLNAGRSDKRSRNIFFVALCRSIGIPARIDPVTAKTQYAKNDSEWIDVVFDTPVELTVSPKGKLGVLVDAKNDEILDKAKYYTNFSISKIVNGLPQLLEFDDFITLKKILDNQSDLDTGQYILTTGQRLANGGVLARSEIFHINENQTTFLPFIIRHDDSQIQVIGGFDSENKYYDIDTKSVKNLLSTTGRGYYVLAMIRPNHEPSEHLLNEIVELADEYEKDGRKLMLIFSNESDADRFRSERFKLPANVVFGIDNENKIANDLNENLQLNSNDAPCVIIADTFNRVVFKSSGYSIGLGQTILNILNRVDN